MMARILLAEDDTSVRRFVARALQIDGHEVVEAEDGGLAVEALEAENGKFDLLLSDIQMPIMDGIALALHTAARFPQMTILLMTGFADQRERAHGLDLLVYDVIAKPFELAMLRQKVTEALVARTKSETADADSKTPAKNSG